MNKRVIVILISALVVLLVAIGIIEVVKHNKNSSTDNTQTSNNSEIGTDELTIGGSSEVGIEVDLETGSIIGEVSDKKDNSSTNEKPQNGPTFEENGITPSNGSTGSNGNTDLNGNTGSNGNPTDSNDNPGNSEDNNTTSSVPLMTPEDTPWERP